MVHQKSFIIWPWKRKRSEGSDKRCQELTSIQKCLKEPQCRLQMHPMSSVGDERWFCYLLVEEAVSDRWAERRKINLVSDYTRRYGARKKQGTERTAPSKPSKTHPGRSSSHSRSLNSRSNISPRMANLSPARLT